MENSSTDFKEFEDEESENNISSEFHNPENTIDSEYPQYTPIIYDAKTKLYIVLIKQADSLFKERKYQEAWLLYQEASDLITKYPYPKNKIVEIGTRLKRKKSPKENKKALEPAIHALEKEENDIEEEWSLWLDESFDSDSLI